MKGKQKELQKQITISDYEMKSIQEILEINLEFLEIYAEKLGIKINKQITQTVTREDILQGDAEKVHRTLLLENTALNSSVSDKEIFLLEPFRSQFLSWLDGSGIDIKSCPTRFAVDLKNIYDILNGQGKAFADKRRKEVAKNISIMTQEEKEQAFSSLLADIHSFREEENKKERSMRGKDYQFDIKNKFSGNPEQGQQTFNEINSVYENNRLQRVNGQLIGNGEKAIINNEEYDWKVMEINPQQKDLIIQEQNNLRNHVYSDDRLWLINSLGIVFLVNVKEFWTFVKSLTSSLV